MVAMSDKDRAIFWKDGIPAEQLVGMAGQTRDLSDVSGGEVRSTDTLFEADSDVLVLAAASYSVDESAVAGIRAPVVVEGANMAFTEEGRIAADSRSLVIVPDVIASSSSAAMVCIQMAERGRVPPDLLWNRIEEGIEEAWNTALSRSHSSGYSPREEHIRMCRT